MQTVKVYTITLVNMSKSSTWRMKYEAKFKIKKYFANATNICAASQKISERLEETT